MTKKGIILSIVLIGIVKHIRSSCTAEQFALTLGEKYSNPVSDKELTISFVTRGICSQNDAKLTLLNPNGEKKVYTKQDTTYNYQTQIEGFSGFYTRVSKFFYLRTPIITEIGNKIVYIIEQDGVSYGPFTYQKKIPNGELKYIWVADMDITFLSRHTVNKLKTTKWENYDGYIHGGDSAYYITDYNGKRGDDYFEKMGKLVHTKTPFLMTPGNHENYDKGKLLNYRFRMPTPDVRFDELSNNYYNVIKGNAMFMFVNYDYFYSLEPTKWNQLFNKLQSDLKEAQLNPAIKWRVVFTHRPMYCSSNKPDCLRNYMQYHVLEAVYQKYKVHFHLSGHNHYYERIVFMDNFVPMKAQIIETANQTRIVEPGKLVHITNGCAGRHTGFLFWRRIIDRVGISQKMVTGAQCYSELTITDETFTFNLFDSETGERLDSVKMFKDKMGLQDNPKPYSSFSYVMAATILILSVLGSWIYWKKYQPKLKHDGSSQMGRLQIPSKDVPEYDYFKKDEEIEDPEFDSNED